MKNEFVRSRKRTEIWSQLSFIGDNIYIFRSKMCDKQLHDIIWTYSEPICYGNLPFFVAYYMQARARSCVCFWVSEWYKISQAFCCCPCGLEYSVSMWPVSVFDDLLFIVTVSMTIPEQYVFNHFMLAFSHVFRVFVNVCVCVCVYCTVSCKCDITGNWYRGKPI